MSGGKEKFTAGTSPDMAPHQRGSVDAKKLEAKEAGLKAVKENRKHLQVQAEILSQEKLLPIAGKYTNDTVQAMRTKMGLFPDSRVAMYGALIDKKIENQFKKLVIRGAKDRFKITDKIEQQKFDEKFAESCASMRDIYLAMIDMQVLAAGGNIDITNAPKLTKAIFEKMQNLDAVMAKTENQKFVDGLKYMQKRSLNLSYEAFPSTEGDKFKDELMSKLTAEYPHGEMTEVLLHSLSFCNKMERREIAQLIFKHGFDPENYTNAAFKMGDNGELPIIFQDFIKKGIYSAAEIAYVVENSDYYKSLKEQDQKYVSSSIYLHKKQEEEHVRLAAQQGARGLLARKGGLLSVAAAAGDVIAYSNIALNTAFHLSQGNVKDALTAPQTIAGVTWLAGRHMYNKNPNERPIAKEAAKREAILAMSAFYGSGPQKDWDKFMTENEGRGLKYMVKYVEEVKKTGGGKISENMKLYNLPRKLKRDIEANKAKLNETKDPKTRSEFEVEIVRLTRLKNRFYKMPAAHQKALKTVIDIFDKGAVSKADDYKNLILHAQTQ